MDFKRVAGAAAIAAGVGISTLTIGIGIGPVNAVPLDPPPYPTSPPIPGEPLVDEPTAPTDNVVVPHSGGSGHGGAPATEEPQPDLQIP
jgi:hypothetical protein